MSVSKLIFLGDRGVGKSSFVLLHGNCRCGCEIVQFKVTDTEVNGKPLTLHLFDSAGKFLEGEYDRVRPCRYADTDLFVLCFDVANRSSFRNVTARWIPEVRQYDPEAQILLLGTKTDLRGGKNEYDDMWMVTKTEGEALGAYLGIPYAECSSLLGDGVQEVIDTAIKLSIQILRHSSRKRLFRDKRKTYVFSPAKGLFTPPPLLPPADFAPPVNVLSSSFEGDWHAMMSDLGSTDVRFMFSDGQVMEAHKTVLMATSLIFRNIFLDKVTPSHAGEIFEEISWNSSEETRCSDIVDTTIEQCQRKQKMVITLNKSISKDVFMEVLSFLYSGSPNIAKDEDVNFVQEIQSVAVKFQLGWLGEYCANILKGDSYLNSSIGIWLNDNTGLKAKTLFLNKALQADVKFRVQGNLVYGHRVILKARSKVMAAMLGDAFRESDLGTEIDIQGVSVESFLALLEFLYTDHAPVEDVDAVQLMILADRFCLPRLMSLCELHITNQMDKAFHSREAGSTHAVIDLLLTSQTYNAKQLSRWCLHLIATNYSVFESTEEFSRLQGENREYVSEHRWPPLSCLTKEEFEEQIKSTKKKFEKEERASKRASKHNSNCKTM